MGKAENAVRGLMNQLLCGVDQIRDLSAGAAVERCAQSSVSDTSANSGDVQAGAGSSFEQRVAFHPVAAAEPTVLRGRTSGVSGPPGQKAR